MIVLAAALLLPGPTLPARPVDFRLAGQVARNVEGTTSGSAGVPLPLAPAGGAEGAGPDEDTTADDIPPPAPPRSHFFMAQGFGRDVPLAFALRQVVPAQVRISYGPGVNQQQPVSWAGGKPWDEVLRSTIKPVGLHVVMSHMAVKIVE